MQYKADRAIIVAALYNSAFPFSYEEVCILGKYFHVQDQVSRKLLEEKYLRFTDSIKPYQMLSTTASRHW